MKQNDILACYDKRIENYSSINNQCKGTPQIMCKLRANTLNESRHPV